MYQAKKSFPIVTILTLSLLLAACQQAPTTGSATSDGAIGGAVLGAVAGALLSNDRAKGALIGAAAGAALGGLAGREIENRKQAYASTEAFYDAQIQQTAQLNRDLSQNNRNLRVSVRNDEQEINRLVGQYNSGRATRTALTRSKQNVDQKYAESNRKLEAAKKELEVQEGVLAEMRQSGGQSGQTAALQREVNELRGEINTLQGTVNQMATQSATLGRYI